MRISHYFALFVLAALIFATGTWSLPLQDRDEPRFAEASREMRERGDYVVPYLNNHYRFDKPPLIYWAQTTCYKFLGESDFAARLPSVLAAAATLLLVYGFGRRLGGDSVGWGAALIFLTSVGVAVHAKGSVADMTMVFFFTLSTWAGWELLRGELSTRSRWGWWSVFYVSLALGFLAKGPVAWLPLVAVGIFVAMRHSRPVVQGATFRVIIGLLLSLALVAAWGIPALEKTHGEFLKVGIGKHVIGRSIGTMEGHGASGFFGYLAMLPFYFITVFVSFFPWSIRLPWLVRRLRRNASALGDDQRYLLLGIALVFGVFTLVKTKLPHYTLPAFPLMAILLAQELHSVPERWASIKRWAGVTLVVQMAVFLLVFPLLTRFSPSYVLIQKSAAALKPEMEFAAASYQEPSLIWYARRHVHGWFSPLPPDKIAEFMAKPGPRFCVASKGTLQPAPDWQVFEMHSFNVNHFKSETLQLMVKP